MGTPGTPFRIEPLSKAHSREGFSCGVAPLDRYLQLQARQDADKRVAAVFVLVKPPGHQVLGYYTLSSSSIDVGQIPADLAKHLSKYPSLPVTLLGRLARDVRLKGRGAGELLLMDAFAKALQATQSIASMAIVVDAKDTAAEAFYRDYGFIIVQDKLRRLFLPMTVVADLFQ